ncbi:HAMP domain-containing protein [Fulvivirga sp. 29W222]|uniref:histidine kinase n=1 Tax=Fulvivirga marina TaxID=2494733 RepID=A0A937FZ16_9BACT|nr:ATP-binding protein [Fulvivirga marina]MBL6448735.1 HAMP domain-containing protein [Fulvivirga marina]
MKTTFKNRIALYYMIATAIVVAVLYGVLYITVKGTVYQNLDSTLSYEASKHTKEIQFEEDIIYFINKTEWEEREHREAQVNPVFIQILNEKGELMDKSPNLKEQQLPFYKSMFGEHFDTKLNNRAIRQVQLPVMYQGKTKGYILAAVSLEPASEVLQDLNYILLISYPVVLIGLFFISRFLAGKSIIPVRKITDASRRITQNSLNERVPLPANEDELYDMANSINALLERMENAMQRERQFTSDASHELRTPLSSLRGTLEVLIRKPRTQAEYEEKVKYSLTEIDRMTDILEQLLLLARFYDSRKTHAKGQVVLIALLDEILLRHTSEIEQKGVKIKVNSQVKDIAVHRYYANLILDNVINNAIKYSDHGKEIHISVEKVGNNIVCQVQDYGIGIKKEDMPHLFNPFFRSDALDHKQIAGTGLGLSIAYKAAEAIKATISVESELKKGTKVIIKFPMLT